MTEPVELLRIYLRDHDAAATGGLALARRCADANNDNELGTYLSAEFIQELETDHELVEKALDAVGTSSSKIKRLMSRAGVVAGRFKLNGAIVSYSPLSRVFELEALISGVHAKHQLWASLEALDHTDLEPHLPDVRAARQRAMGQLTELEHHHQLAAAEAFAPYPKGTQR